jgi:hypothetical protein
MGCNIKTRNPRDFGRSITIRQSSRRAGAGIGAHPEISIVNRFRDSGSGAGRTIPE